MEEEQDYTTPPTRPGPPPKSVRDKRRENKVAARRASQDGPRASHVPTLQDLLPSDEENLPSDEEKISCESPPLSPKKTGPDFALGFLPWWKFNALPWQTANYDSYEIDLFYQWLYFTTTCAKPSIPKMREMWGTFSAACVRDRAKVEREVGERKSAGVDGAEARMMKIHRICMERGYPCAASLLIASEVKVNACSMCFDDNEFATKEEDLAGCDALIGLY